MYIVLYGGSMLFVHCEGEKLLKENTGGKLF